MTGRCGVGCERGGGGSEAACRAAKRTAASEPWWDQFSMRSQQQSGFGKEGGPDNLKLCYLTLNLLDSWLLSLMRPTTMARMAVPTSSSSGSARALSSAATTSKWPFWPAA